VPGNAHQVMTEVGHRSRLSYSKLGSPF
jgi:hypothetical protein